MNLILEERGIGYRERTRYNAESADLTIAIAIDFETAGERLTKSAAKDKYLALPYDGDVIETARKLYRVVSSRGVRKLNVAGNGLTHWRLRGIYQRLLNKFVFDVLALVHQHHPFTHIRSGGQTGADFAGLVAAVALGIPATGTFPMGFLQRTSMGDDVRRSPEDIEFEINKMVAELKSGT